MPPRKNGLRRSSATTFRRRLIIFRRLFRADCSASELIESVNLALNHDGYPPAATMALKHDLDALKHEYNCVIRFDRKTNCYKILSVGDFAILDLPSESVDALNFIDKNFHDDYGDNRKQNGMVFYIVQLKNDKPFGKQINLFV